MGLQEESEEVDVDGEIDSLKFGAEIAKHNALMISLGRLGVYGPILGRLPLRVFSIGKYAFQKKVTNVQMCVAMKGILKAQRPGHDQEPPEYSREVPPAHGSGKEDGAVQSISTTSTSKPSPPAT